jgi:predicted nucleic acid-binding protein
VILVDTSVWIDHLNKSDPVFFHLLQEGQIMTHPFVVGEIALGNLRNRSVQLVYMTLLPVVKVAREDEALHVIERHRLFGTGLGYVDVHLLASASISSVALWTRDKRLSQAAEKLGLARGP